MNNPRNNQPLTLPADLAQAEELYQRVAKAATELLNSINAVEAGDKVVSDPTWVRRARGCLRHLVRDRERLCAHTARLRREERRNHHSHFQRQLLAVLKERAPRDLFQGCVQEAERRVKRADR